MAAADSGNCLPSVRTRWCINDCNSRVIIETACSGTCHPNTDARNPHPAGTRRLNSRRWPSAGSAEASAFASCPPIPVRSSQDPVDAPHGVIGCLTVRIVRGMATSLKLDFGVSRDIGHRTNSSRRAEMGKARVHRGGHVSRRRASQHSIEYHAGIKALGPHAEY